jgi:hypothetical protein
MKTIYIVEQLFGRADWEQEWSDWYNGNLNVLLSVPGFRSAQRFRHVGNTPRYLAMYTVDSPAVFETPVYIAAGGNGANSVRFRPAYQLWTRNLYDDAQMAMNVGLDQFLLVEDVTDAHAPQRPGARRLTCSGMHKTFPFRDLTALAAPINPVPANAICYRPLTARLGQLYKD